MSTHNCDSCVVQAELERMGVKLDKFDRVVALAGNPNTGKSTLFNALTGLKQHTGNWPGKTVSRAEGGFEFNKVRYKLVDLPGTYSLLSASHDEEIARDFLLFGRPDATIVVVDATALERNLNLVLQVLEITDRVVVAVNLMDEAQAQGHRGGHAEPGAGPRRARRSASSRARAKGCTRCSSAVDGVSSGAIDDAAAARDGHAGVPARGRRTRAAHRASGPGRAQRALDRDPSARWRRRGRRGARQRPPGASWSAEQQRTAERFSRKIALRGSAVTHGRRHGRRRHRTRRGAPRRRCSSDFRDEAVRSIYAEAARVAGRAAHADAGAPVDLDQRIDRLVTSPVFGLPIMALLLAVVFWLTIAGANVPSAMLARCFFWIEDQAAALLRRARPAVVAHGIHLARRLSRPRLGRQRDAAADGHLLPAVHDPRRSRLSAARGVQPRLPVPTRRRARQAGADDGDGLRVQRGRASSPRGSSTRRASGWSRSSRTTSCPATAASRR